ncbi:MAG TPA: septum formation initiator family protein [Patescibacteria group bacterium]
MKKKIFSTAAALFVIGMLLAVGISYSAVREAYRNKKIESEVADLKAQAQKVQDENDALSQKIAYLQTPEFQEKIAKDKLNMQKPDENVVVVKQSAQQDSEDPVVQSVQNNEDQTPNYRKWWDLFFKY